MFSDGERPLPHSGVNEDVLSERRVFVDLHSGEIFFCGVWLRGVNL